MAESYVWIASNATEHPLTVLWDLAGRLGTSSTFDLQPATFDGSTLVATPRTAHRVAQFPIKVTAASETALVTALDTLIATMRPGDGIGKLRCTRHDGRVRDLDCYAQLDIREVAGDTSMPTWQRAVATFTAPDPYWYGSDITAVLSTVNDTGNEFFPIPDDDGVMVNLTAGSLVVTATLANAGDVPAWPVWTITGPMDTLTIENLATGKQIVITPTLVTTESMQIDTRPQVSALTDISGSRVHHMARGSSFFSVAVGGEQVRITATGTSAGSAVAYRYAEGFLSP